MVRWLAKVRARITTKNFQPDEAEFVYELPFEPGACFTVIQGYGGLYSHTGVSHFSIDFSMPEMTPICAARSGVIYRVIDHFSESGTHPSFKSKANAIYVLHHDDTMAAYVHLPHGGAYVRAGDFVFAGQTIGLSGNTGWSGSPHLHFHVSDAFYHRRIPTKFNISVNVAGIVEVNKRYTRPMLENRSQIVTRPIGTSIPCHSKDAERDAFAFFPELLNLSTELVSDHSTAGFEQSPDYCSIDAMHDVYGLEVCGIHDPQIALNVIRFLLLRFPGWNAGWLHPPDDASTQEWVARIQLHRDEVLEYWETD
jgi:murein DD-endopeptidase MepM/ murein hydrolase activator NlpD